MSYGCFIFFFFTVQTHAIAQVRRLDNTNNVLSFIPTSITQQFLELGTSDFIIENIVYEKVNSNFFHPGKSSQLNIGKNILARFGEIHPFILQKFEIKTNVNGFEIYLDNLNLFQSKKLSTKNAFDNNALQLVERDFAFLFSKDIQITEIIKTIRKIDKNVIKKVTIFDVYEGKNIPNNMKSIAFKVILQPIEKTFTDQEIENISSKIIDLISKTFEGKLRQ